MKKKLLAAATMALGIVGFAGGAWAQCNTYTMTVGNGSIDPGTADTGNHCDDCTTAVALPFPITYYGTSYSTIYACSNGWASFDSTSGTGYFNSCLPSTGTAAYNVVPGHVLMVHWDDMYTVNAGTGIYTSVSGVSPTRVFNIEWRSQYYPGTGNANFEIRLFEDNSRIEYVYGAVSNTGASATIGTQDTLSAPTQYECSTGGVTNGLKLTFSCGAVSAPPSGAGAANPSTLNSGQSTLLTVVVTPGSVPTSTGLNVQGDLSAIGGSTTQVFYDNGTHGDAVAGDNTFSFLATVPASQLSGNPAIPWTVADAQSRSGSGTINLTVYGTDVWVEAAHTGGDAGDLPATAQVCDGSGPLSQIIGSLNVDADMYQIQICDPSSFSATTVGTVPGAPVADTQLFLFDSNGLPVTSDDDDPLGVGGVRSRLSNAFVSGAGTYFLAISAYNNDPMSDGGLIWANTPFNVERAPDGPGAGSAPTSWTGGGATGDYIIWLTGACLGVAGDHMTASGAATPSTVDAGSATLLTVTVHPQTSPPSSGIIVHADLSSAGGSNNQAFFDDGTHGDAVAGDLIYSYSLTIPSSAATGALTLPWMAMDNQGNTPSGNFHVNVNGNDTWREASHGTGDAGDLPSTAQSCDGAQPGLPLHQIVGTLGGDADMYLIHVCDPSNFSATTGGFAGANAVGDTQLYIFDHNGMPLAMDDDDPQGVFGLRSRLSNSFLQGEADYYIAVSGYDNDPNSDGGPIWQDTPFNVERAPDGAGAGSAPSFWDGGGAAGDYVIVLTGACLVNSIPPCVADFDDGSGTGHRDGGVTIDDLLYYLALFANGDIAADIDNGTGTGTQDGGVTIEDLLFFLQHFAAGC